MCQTNALVRIEHTCVVYTVLSGEFWYNEEHYEKTAWEAHLRTFTEWDVQLHSV